MLIFALLYTSILSAFLSDAPIFSSFVVLYALVSLYAYFGITEEFDFFQSNFVVHKLAFVGIGFLAESLISHNGSNLTVYFGLMLVVLFYDALRGAHEYFNQSEFCGEEKSFYSKKNVFTGDNWKSGLLWCRNSALKTLAIAVLALQVSAATSMMFSNISSVVGVLLLAYSLVGVAIFQIQL